jgi:hypothetical protein
MAIIECSECNREISDKAENCPGCGAPVNGKQDLSKCPKCGSTKTVSATEMHPVGCLMMIVMTVIAMLFFWPLGILMMFFGVMILLGVSLFGKGKMVCKACKNTWRLDVKKIKSK